MECRLDLPSDFRELIRVSRKIKAASSPCADNRDQDP
jgi:hypothetical protein